MLLNIGYVYDFIAFPPQHGGSIHVYNLVGNLVRLGCRIHTFDCEVDGICENYVFNDDGINEFVENIGQVVGEMLAQLGKFVDDNQQIWKRFR